MAMTGMCEWMPAGCLMYAGLDPGLGTGDWPGGLCGLICFKACTALLRFNDIPWVGRTAWLLPISMVRRYA